MRVFYEKSNRIFYARLLLLRINRQSGNRKGLVNENILPLASPFSGGLSSGCLCGAVAGMQLVFGSMFGRDDKDRNGMIARKLAKKSIEMFKEKNKYTCCKALTAGYDMASSERKQHCVKMVETCAEIIEELIKQPVA